MNKDEALKMAIELIEGTKLHDYSPHIYDEVITACKEALEQPAQAPVAWMHRHAGEITEFNDFQSCQYCEPLYTHPHQWQELTDDEIDKVYYKTFDTWSSEVDIEFARAIEQALKEKNT